MKRQVILVKFHDLLVTLPGVGSLGNELPLKTKSLDLQMFEGPTGIELIIKGVKGVNVIPYANVKLYTLAPEVVLEAATEAKSKK